MTRQRAFSGTKLNLCCPIFKLHLCTWHGAMEKSSALGHADIATSSTDSDQWPLWLGDWVLTRGKANSFYECWLIWSSCNSHSCQWGSVVPRILQFYQLVNDIAGPGTMSWLPKKKKYDYLGGEVDNASDWFTNPMLSTPCPPPFQKSLYSRAPGNSKASSMPAEQRDTTQVYLSSPVPMWVSLTHPHCQCFLQWGYCP